MYLKICVSCLMSELWPQEEVKILTQIAAISINKYLNYLHEPCYSSQACSWPKIYCMHETQVSRWVYDLKWWRDQPLERHSGQKERLLCRVRLTCSVCRCVSIHRSSAEECVNPEDKSKAIVCDVAYQNKSAGFCPAYPSLFTGTDVTISNFKVC